MTRPVLGSLLDFLKHGLNLLDVPTGEGGMVFPMKNIFLLSAIFLTCLVAYGAESPPADAGKTASSPHDYAKALGDTLADIVQKVSPAVVVINVWYPSEPREEGSADGKEDGPFEFFFPQPHGRGQP